MYTRMNGRNRQYSLSHTEEGTAITGHPATIVKLEGGALRMQEVGNNQAVETAKEHETFITHLKNYGGEWFWETFKPLMAQSGWLKQSKRNTDVSDRRVVHGTLTPQHKRSRVDHPRQSNRKASPGIAG